MLNILLDEIQINEQAEYNKDYKLKTHILKVPYQLNVGDLVHSIHYKGRGLLYYDCRILDINKKGICIYEGKKIVFLKWKDHDDRQLVLEPFYIFNTGINDKNFFNTVTKSLNDFVTTHYELDSKFKIQLVQNNKFKVEQAKSYIINYKNIMLEQFKETAKQINIFSLI